jgi:cell division protein FtsL
MAVEHHAQQIEIKKLNNQIDEQNDAIEELKETE